MESKELSWAYCTVDTLLNRGPCELHSAYLVVSAASTDSAIYDGTDTSGRKITDLRAAAVTGHHFKPKEPIYCQSGLYVDVGTNVSGILVQWRKLA